ncbi:MAG: hypothetical protein LUE96_07265 [Lachnospiraceae bacterium]|nr:hypothetical protein [Lachnospiraceae bacterium]
MKNVSEEYIAALYDSASVSSTISGTITTESGTIYALSDSDIITGMLSVNNKCVSSSSFELGAVYQGELAVTLKTDIDRYALLGAEITFTEHRLLADGTTEDVSLGIFYISEATRSKKTLAIKALDAMDSLDVDIEEDTYGTVYALMCVIADTCGVVLAQDEDEINALPNAEEIFYVYAEEVDTYRTLAAYLGMVTGTFATINTDGELEMRSFAQEASLEIPAAKRDSTSVEDYETYYGAVTARFIADENYYTYTYEDEEVEGGLTLDMGDIPIVRGESDFKYEILANVLAKIEGIRYTPASFTLISDAAIELGDMLTVGGEDADVVITSFTWKYHGAETLKGVGDNPRLKYTDSTSKQITALSESVSSKTMVVNTYTNTSDISLGTSEKQIISMSYAAVANTHPVFIATVPLTMDCDGVVMLSYYIDGVHDTGHDISKYLERGEHFLTFENHYAIEKDNRVTLSVRAAVSYFESDTRRQEASIATFENFLAAKAEQEEENLRSWIEELADNPEAELTPLSYDEGEIDTTAPTAAIEAGTIRAVLFAQGLATSTEWDGTINISETVTATDIAGLITAAGVTDSEEAGLITPARGTASEGISAITLAGLVTAAGFETGVSEELADDDSTDDSTDSDE